MTTDVEVAAMGPDIRIGDLFAYDGHTFRVAGWMKPRPHPAFGSRGVGPDKCPLVFCGPEDAVYVSGSGVCGIIVRIADVRVTGRVAWPEEALEQARRCAAALVGRRVV